MKLAAFLFLLPAGLVLYKVLFMGYPLIPTMPGKAFKVLFEATVKGSPGQELTIKLALPADHEGLLVTEEQAQSGILTFSILLDNETRWGIWSGQLGDSEELISYAALLVPRAGLRAGSQGVSPGAYPQGTEPGERALARRMAMK